MAEIGEAAINVSTIMDVAIKLGPGFNDMKRALADVHFEFNSFLISFCCHISLNSVLWDMGTLLLKLSNNNRIVL